MIKTLFDIAMIGLLSLGAWKALELFGAVEFWWHRRATLPLLPFLGKLSPTEEDFRDVAARLEADARRLARQRERHG